MNVQRNENMNVANVCYRLGRKKGMDMEDKKEEIMDLLEKIAILGVEVNDPVGNLVSASCLILLEAVQNKQLLQIFSSTMYNLCDKLSEVNTNTIH